MTEVLINIQATPNPNAWKFVLDKSVLDDGKMTYTNLKESESSDLANSLFKVDGVKQVHFFQNVITITNHFDVDIEKIKSEVSSVIQTRMPSHNSKISRIDELKLAREKMPEDQRQIEEILDRTIRPGLQGDGGDITVKKLEEGKVYVTYEGACGTCPSSTTGTLMAIEGILREQLNNPELQVMLY